MRFPRPALAALLLALAPATATAQAVSGGPGTNLFTREAGASVHAFSSEFGSGWVAENLVPSTEALAQAGTDRPEFVWSSASQAPFPHWVTIDLGRPTWLTTLVFDNALADEPDHPGISARAVEVHVGDAPTALRRVASFELERNRTGQAVQLAPVQARYVKLLITSNWGHPWYTELGATQAFDDGTRPGDLAGELARRGRVDVYGIYFDFASATLRTESATALGAIAAWAKANPGKKLVIEGHTDAVGGDAPNRVLSERRAQRVVAELVKLGVPAAALSAVGHGAAQPVASNATDAGRAKNRRVTVVLAT